MKLRKLRPKDAPLMLEWMHDESVVKGNLREGFLQKTLADCEAFIAGAQRSETDLHLAVVDDRDEYMGTVSLKGIRDGGAEFAIAVRNTAMGKGFAKYAMAEIIRIGLEEMGLERIYWYVKPNNLRALRFYDKNGYMRTTASNLRGGYASGTGRLHLVLADQVPEGETAYQVKPFQSRQPDLDCAIFSSWRAPRGRGAREGRGIW